LGKSVCKVKFVKSGNKSHVKDAGTEGSKVGEGIHRAGEKRKNNHSGGRGTKTVKKKMLHRQIGKGRKKIANGY